jgi:hypothetical protein
MWHYREVVELLEVRLIGRCQVIGVTDMRNTENSKSSGPNKTSQITDIFLINGI